MTREGDRLPHRLGLVYRFLELPFRRRVVHPAASRLYVSLAILHQRRPDRDAVVGVAIEGEVPDASAVRAAGRPLQFRNDLHGADLGRASQRAGREGRTHQVVRRAVRPQLAVHL